MPTQEEIFATYEKATRELARVCNVRLRVRKTTNYHSGMRINLLYPNALGPYSMAATNWLDAFDKVERFARLRGIPLPPSAQSLVEKGE